MSLSLSAAARQEFDDQVKQAYQGGGNLRSAVTLRRNVVGDIYKFRKMGKGLANQKASQADVTPMNVAHSLINCTLENWNAPEYTDIFDQAEVNFDEQRELAMAIAKALGRREDQLVIDALEASTPATTDVGVAVGGANTGLNVAKLRRAKKELDAKGVGSEGRHIAHTALALEDLLGETEVQSSDYNTVKALVQGDVNTFMGFTFHLIEDRDEGGLSSPGANTRNQWAWHREAVGLAIGIDIRTEVNYIAQKTSWLANGIFKAGAVVRDTDGVVKIQTYEA